MFLRSRETYAHATYLPDSSQIIYSNISMIAVLIISFREFLEAFLIVGVFLGLSRKLKLKKETEIIVATLLGVLISLILAAVTYLIGDISKNLFNEGTRELIENILLLFSGVFLAYVVFSLHEKIGNGKNLIIQNAKKQLENQVFDFSLFSLILFLILREGFEIALFTSSTSVLNVFFQNILGLVIGFFSASIFGLGAFLAYEKFPIKKVFKATEYMIILLGASMVQVGVTELSELKLGIHLGDILPLGLGFLPEEHTVAGGLIRTFTGIDREFSLSRFFVMLIYIMVVYYFFSFRKVKATI